jgi:cell division protein FtsB
MNMWFAIFAIVTVVMIADTVKKVAKAKAQKKTGDAELKSMLARIDELEERIRVLERIVTEDKHDLRREIDRL